ncbi:MAG: secondary thiamine-phosphate synthase enzyme YjbQ [Eubacteriales bacterium]
MVYIFELPTYKQCTLINITTYAREAVKKSGILSGIATIYCPHTTAGITINENADPDVTADILAALVKMVPEMEFKHIEGNSPAHIKTLLTGSSVSVPVNQGNLALGRWQSVYFCEYDGPRDRKFYVQVVGE